jgi:hypothetical protein
MSKKEDLPSINDIVEDTNLPSYKDFIENNEELPSVEEYKTEPLEEDNQTIENANGETFAEIIDVVKAPEWQELLTLVNKVREDIPKIPEIKYYDDELGDLSEKITEIQENLSRFDLKSDKIYHLDAKNEEFEVKLNEIELKIPEIPEVRYYEGDIDYIYKKIDLIKEEITNLPEVKYYESDLKNLKTRIEQVNESIPTFPDWVNKVEEVPDFSWIGKTFGVIDDDFKKVQGHIDLITEKINLRVSEINETIEVKDFEQRVDLKDLKENYKTTKDKIVKEFKEVALKIYDHHKEFKDDDRKLKKAVLSEQNKLKQILTKEITKINEESIKTDEKIIGFFNSLKENVEQKFSSLPEVKYYDDDIKTLKQDVRFVKVSVKNCLEDIKKISLEIKKTQVELSEGLLNEPPNEKETAGNQTDPLTPLDQKFATLDDLSKHYRLFINRIQTQLSTMGGGGAGFIKDLDDVTFDGTDGQLLIYNSSTSKWVGIASTAVGGGDASTLAENTTGTNLVLSGNLTVAGIATYEDVRNLDSIGIVTARSGINVLAGGITAVGVVTATKLHVGVDTGFYNENLVVNGDARVTGILTIGTGSITLDPNEKKISGIDEIIIGTGTTVRIHQDSSGEIVFSDREGKQASVGIGTTVSINTTGIVTAATLKASTAFYPPIYTTAQRDAGSFDEGAIIFNTTSKKMEFYDGSNWQSLPGMTLGLTVALDG